MPSVSSMDKTFGVLFLSLIAQSLKFLLLLPTLVETLVDHSSFYHLGSTVGADHTVTFEAAYSLSKVL